MAASRSRTDGENEARVRHGEPAVGDAEDVMFGDVLRGLLYVCATAAMVFLVVVDVVVPALLATDGAGRVDLGADRLVGLPLIAIGA